MASHPSSFHDRLVSELQLVSASWISCTCTFIEEGTSSISPIVKVYKFTVVDRDIRGIEVEGNALLLEKQCCIRPSTRVCRLSLFVNEGLHYMHAIFLSLARGIVV